MNKNSSSATRLAQQLVELTPQLLHAIVLAARADTHLYDSNAVMQVHTLRALAEGPLTFKDLIAFRRVSAPTLSRTIETLVKRGWVQRTEHPQDRRQLLLKLTPEGSAEFNRMRDSLVANLAKSMKKLNADEREVVQQAILILQRTFNENTAPIKAH
jgi:DNA-binding MarR family transcriptional regulator